MTFDVCPLILIEALTTAVREGELPQDEGDIYYLEDLTMELLRAGYGQPRLSTRKTEAQA